MSAPVRVAVVDDSSFVRKALVRMLEGDERVRIVGVAASGEELLGRLAAWRPEVVTLDLSMPGLGGLATLDVLVERRPDVAVIVLSSFSLEGARRTLEALHRGALDFVDKREYSMVDFQALRQVLLDKILGLVRPAGAGRAAQERRGGPPAAIAAPEGAVPPCAAGQARGFDAVLLAASTGGPPALQRVLEDLGPAPGVPILVVQHMPPRFTTAFSERLNAVLPLAVREARNGEALLPSTVYVAPGGVHLLVDRGPRGLVARLAADPPLRHRPSADVLFRSGAAALGSHAVVGVLTGMGRDGARGMLEVAAAGGWTLAQDRETSVVYGMPRAAIEAGAAREVLPLGTFGGRIAHLLSAGAGRVSR
jgi:two-component system chemotaxis response regulator CheB